MMQRNTERTDMRGALTKELRFSRRMAYELPLAYGALKPIPHIPAILWNVGMRGSAVARWSAP